MGIYVADRKWVRFDFAGPYEEGPVFESKGLTFFIKDNSIKGIMLIQGDEKTASGLFILGNETDHIEVRRFVDSSEIMNIYTNDARKLVQSGLLTHKLIHLNTLFNIHFKDVFLGEWSSEVIEAFNMAGYNVCHDLFMGEVPSVEVDNHGEMLRKLLLRGKASLMESEDVETDGENS